MCVMLMLTCTTTRFEHFEDVMYPLIPTCNAKIPESTIIALSRVSGGSQRMYMHLICLYC